MNNPLATAKARAISQSQSQSLISPSLSLSVSQSVAPSLRSLQIPDTTCRNPIKPLPKNSSSMTQTPPEIQSFRHFDFKTLSLSHSVSKSLPLSVTPSLCSFASFPPSLSHSDYQLLSRPFALFVRFVPPISQSLRLSAPQSPPLSVTPSLCSFASFPPSLSHSDSQSLSRPFA